MTLALGGHLLVGQHNNQLKVGVCGMRDIGEGARPGRNVWEGHHTIVWGGKLRKKTSWPEMTADQYFKCNNLPKTRGREGGENSKEI